jgi:hypothetical protein
MRKYLESLLDLFFNPGEDDPPPGQNRYTIAEIIFYYVLFAFIIASAAIALP